VFTRPDTRALIGFLSKGQHVKTIAAALVILIGLTAAILAQADGTAQQGLSVGVDADPSGNTATSLGTIDSCVSVKKGDEFAVDVFVTEVSDLLGWEAYFSFDGSILNVTDRDVKLFQAASAGSDVFDASESLPSSGGLYRLGAIDIAQPLAPDSGSGVLARLTLEAVGAGISPAILITLDANNDGSPDLGNRLLDPQGLPIGDNNGDAFFDGPVFNAQIAVGRDCPTGPAATPVATISQPTVTSTPVATPAANNTSTTIPTAATTETSSPTPRITPTPGTSTSPTPPPSVTATPRDNGGTDWTSTGLIVIYAVVGGAAALLLGGGAFLAVTRRRGP